MVTAKHDGEPYARFASRRTLNLLCNPLPHLPSYRMTVSTSPSSIPDWPADEACVETDPVATPGGTQAWVAVLITLLSAGLFAALFVGCASWHSDVELAPLLPPPQPSHNASVVDIAFVPLPVAEGKVDWELWNEVDEQVLPKQLRELLAANGLRAGRIEGQLPEVIASAMDNQPGDDSSQLLQQAELVSEVSHTQRRMFCRPGSRYELPVRSQIQGDVSLIVRHPDTLSGWRLADPLFQFAVETRLGDRGETILRLIPEIKHGNLKQSWVSSEQALRMESRRSTQIIEHLIIEIPLRVGQALLISPTSTPRGLGQQMFMGKRIDATQDVVALVLRLSKEPNVLASSP